jgi:hypothetical protein
LTYGLNARANDDGGVTESDNCEYNTLNGLSTLLKSSSLIITPNSYKEGKLYSVIPSDGSGDMSVTRATTATRVNSAGLVELVPYNLFQQSEVFSNAYWTKASISVINANAAISPNGTLTADLLYPLTSGFAAFIRNTNFYPYAPNATFSIYAKYEGIQYMNYLNIAGTGVGISFDLLNGTTSVLDTNMSSTIASVGNGWYRCTVTASNMYVYFGVCSSGTTFDITKNGTNGIYVWGAQLVQGTSALDYQATETRLNIPRLDYSLGSCPNILLEPQRTNLCSNNLGFSVFGGCTIASETTNSPFGNTSDVFKVTSLGAGGVRANENIPFTSGNTYSCGHFIKFVTAITLNFSASAGQFPNNGNFIFDVSGNPSKTGDVDYIAYPNGWYYVYIKASVTSTTSGRVNIAPSLGSFLIFKSQYELGANATSYIPTTSASVTRNADAISKTGISSLIGQTEGVLFVDFNFTKATDVYRRVFAISDNTANNLISINLTATGSAEIYIINGSTTQVAFTNNILSVNARYKIAVGYIANNVVLYINGVLINTDLNCTIPTCSGVYLGKVETAGSTGFLNDTINSAILFKTRLTNTQLAQLTTI